MGQDFSDLMERRATGYDYVAELDGILAHPFKEIGLKKRYQKLLLTYLDKQNFWSLILQDLLSFSRRDPALWQRFEIILQSQSFQALLLYRVAHSLLSSGVAGFPDGLRKECSFLLTRFNRVTNGVDIHPNAVIGQRTILDHVFGLVVGETAVIGNDCYVLGGVTLGASGIADNPRGRRHPIIGHNVQIGAYARLLGAIQVGDNCFIAPHAVVTKDVCPNTKVSIVNQLQITRSELSAGQKFTVFGVKIEQNEVVIFCDSKSWIKPDFVDENFVKIPSFWLIRKSKIDDCQRFRMDTAHKLRHLTQCPLHLRIATRTHEIHVMHIGAKIYL